MTASSVVTPIGITFDGTGSGSLQAATSEPCPSFQQWGQRIGWEDGDG